MTKDRTILITGVTGNQGGAVAQALQGTGFHLRGLTRTPDSQRAAALARNGIDIVKGDLDDEATLRRALVGAWGVFSVQNAGEAGVEREEAQGQRLARHRREPARGPWDVARWAGSGRDASHTARSCFVWPKKSERTLRIDNYERNTI
jgi:uncharacterized protein YbjT (DUF2867 family)